METNKQQSKELLNNLVEINNDRIEGYEKAISLLPEDSNSDLRVIFENYKNQSIQFKNELEPLVFQTGELPTEETRTSGKIFRTWMAIRSVLSPSTVKSILESCERGEDEFKKIYSEALTQSDLLALDMLNFIQNQAKLQLQAHDHIKLLRDNEPHV